MSRTTTAAFESADEIFDDGMECWWAGAARRPSACAQRGSRSPTGYVAPMLLGARWERLDAFHGTSMAEPEWADYVVKAQAELWHAPVRR